MEKSTEQFIKEHNLTHLKKVLAHFESNAVSQEKYGINKYGQGLDPMSEYDWLDMATQEVVDMYKYFLCEKERRDYVYQVIKSQLEYLIDKISKNSIGVNEVLDILKSVIRVELNMLKGKPTEPNDKEKEKLSNFVSSLSTDEKNYLKGVLNNK